MYKWIDAFLGGQVEVCFSSSNSCNLTALFPWKQIFSPQSKMVKRKVNFSHWSIGLQFSFPHASQLDAVQMTSSACCSKTPHMERRFGQLKTLRKACFLRKSYSTNCKVTDNKRASAKLSSLIWTHSLWLRKQLITGLGILFFCYIFWERALRRVTWFPFAISISLALETLVTVSIM